MADIFTPLSTGNQIFTSKSRPPFHQSLSANVLGRHNAIPSTAASTQPLKVTQKRRHADDSDDDMERRSQSPSPEKRVMAKAGSRKLLVKKARLDAENGSNGKEENKRNEEGELDVADARVLLANLPLSSYPAMVQALLDKEPSITKLLISVIPRPSAEAAREAIVQATKQLKDAIPYSAAQAASSSRGAASYTGSVGGRTFSSQASAASSTSSALGLTTGATAPGFGALGLNTGDFTFGSSNAAASTSNSNSVGQRDAYVLSRLRPAIQAFESTVHAYLPYFSLIPAPVSLLSLQTKSTSSKSEDQQSHPDETFIVLASLTNSILSLPSKAATALNEQSGLADRLMKEWKAWLDHLDLAVNTKGEMFSGDQARSWIHALDNFAIGQTVSASTAPGFGSSFAYGGSSGFGFGFGGPSASGWGATASSGIGGWGGSSNSTNATTTNASTIPANNLPELRNLRDAWVAKVGWLVGRQPPVPGFEAMDEL